MSQNIANEVIFIWAQNKLINYVSICGLIVSLSLSFFLSTLFHYLSMSSTGFIFQVPRLRLFFLIDVEQC